MSAGRLIVAVGNPSRGDDALGPKLLEALRALDVERGGRVELLEEFQLQVEHVLDLVGREGVLFVDASNAPVPGGAALTRIAPRHGQPPASHALPPDALLGVFEQVQGVPAPPAWLLAVQGTCFELGAALSAPARQHLDAALRLARDWIANPCPAPGSCAAVR